MSNELPLKALGISTAAILGVLLRLAVNRLFSASVANVTSDTSALFLDLPANFLGCLILGLHESTKRRFLYPDWYSLAISTGLAGSVTTFASWHLQLTIMLVAGPRVQAFVAIPIGLSMAFFAFSIGKDIGDILLNTFRRGGEENSSATEERALDAVSQSGQVRVLVSLVLAFVGVYAAMVGGAIFDSRSFATNHRRFFWMCGVFAPFGALLRWWLSRFNQKAERFPLGTFAANMTAMVLDLSIAAALRVNGDISYSAVFLLSAVISGLGGSLSTVSTWVNEATKLRRGWRYLYVLGTSSAALILGIIIYGTAHFVS